MTLWLVGAALAGPVSPAFGWRAQDRWAVTFDRVSEQAGTATAMTAHTTATWTWTVRAVTGGLEVVASDYALQATTGLPRGGDDAEGVAAALQAAAPSLRVSAAATVTALLDPSTQRAAAERLLRASRTLSGPRVEAFKAQLSDAGLRTATDEWWSRLVGSWAGQTFYPGQPDHLTVSAPVTFLGGTSVQHDVTQGSDGTAPCPRATTTPCGRFTLRMVPNPGALKVAIRDHQAAAASSNNRLATAEAALEVELYAEPVTLVPHQLRVVRTTHLVGAPTSGKATLDSRTTETATWSFTRR